MQSIIGAIFIILVVVLSLLFIAFNVYLLYIHRKYSHLPSPKGAGFYTGHTSAMNTEMKSGRYFVELFMKWADECGPVYVIWLMAKPLVLVAHPDVIKQLGTIKHPKPRMYETEKIWNKQRCVGHRSIFTIQHYEDWKDRRRTYDPAFAKNSLHDLVPQFNKVIQKYLVHRLKELTSNGQTVVDMKNVFSRVTLEVISEVAFGMMDIKEDKYVKELCGSQDVLSLVDIIFEGMLLQGYNPWMPYLKPFGGYKYTNAAAKLREIGRYCIKNRIKLIENKEECPKDILTQIITFSQKDGAGMDIEDLVDDFVTFYIAGQDTTANNLSFALAELLQSPEYLQRCEQEVDEVFGSNSDTDINVRDLEKLEFIQAVLEESLRLHPTATEVEKLTGEEIVTNDYRIPKDTTVWISQYIPQHNPEYFDNPMKFDPSRFEPGQKRPSPYVYLPFGIGHRSCIGRAFSMIESKIILALLLKNFKLSPTEGYKMKKVYSGVSKPEDVTCYISLRK